MTMLSASVSCAPQAARANTIAAARSSEMSFFIVPSLYPAGRARRDAPALSDRKCKNAALLLFLLRHHDGDGDDGHHDDGDHDPQCGAAAALAGALALLSGRGALLWLGRGLGR